MNCSICQAEFIPKHKHQKTCLHDICRTEQKRQEARQRAERREFLAKREAIKTRAQWLKEAQAVFNAYIRERDKHLPCISCGKPLRKENTDAGHYRSVGSTPELRFDEDNVHAQCSRPCNHDLSGNSIAYRKGLINRIGLDRLDRLEGNHSTKKYTVEDIREIKRIYQEKLKALRAKGEL